MVESLNSQMGKQPRLINKQRNRASRYTDTSLFLQRSVPAARLRWACLQFVIDERVSSEACLRL